MLWRILKRLEQCRALAPGTVHAWLTCVINEFFVVERLRASSVTRAASVNSGFNQLSSAFFGSATGIRV